jgi:small subunit ribosomal protein S8
MISDPISNMLISMKNSAMVSKETVTVPFSNLKFAIAQCLKDNGFVANVSKKTQAKNIPVIELALVYDNGVSKIHDVKRLSKPSRRSYVGVKELHTVKNGHGLLVISTPKGIMTDKQARKEQVGGEALFMIW